MNSQRTDTSGRDSAKLHGADSATPGARRPGAVRAAWVVCGIALAALMCAAAWVGRAAAADEPVILHHPGVMIPFLLAGGAYLVAGWLSSRPGGGGSWAVILLVAVVIRLAMSAVPLAEGGDYQRYLWDGAVTAAGINPYRHSPREAMDPHADPRLRAVAAEGRGVLEKVGFPQLRTIYPPAAQGLFAVAHLLSPFGVAGWRAVLLTMDVLTAWLVVSLLRAEGAPRALAVIYLWNPLVVFETYARLHLDLALCPLLLVFAWALLRRRGALAGLALAGAVGVKLWPAMLIPFLVGTFWRDWRRLGVAVGAFVAPIALMGLPFADAFAGDGSGAVAYTMNWEGGHGAYAIFDWAGWSLSRAIDAGVDGNVIGRALMLATLGGLVSWLGLRPSNGAGDLCGRIALAALLMLLLSPILWPWYYVAIVPLAALSPAPALLAWTALLGLIYLPVGPAGERTVAVLVHLPLWCLLAARAAQALRRRARRA